MVSVMSLRSGCGAVVGQTLLDPIEDLQATDGNHQATNLLQKGKKTPSFHQGVKLAQTLHSTVRWISRRLP